MIDLELYRIFSIVAETGNITKASSLLNISQPAVTKHIKNLEYYLGGSLFIRTKKGVVLNDDGKKMFLLIKQALSLIDVAEKQFKNLENLESGSIKIGISTTLTRKFLFNYIKDFHRLYPNIVLNINTDPTKELIKNLKDGLIDFIIAKCPESNDNELEYITLGELEDIFVVNEDFKDLLEKDLNLSDIVKYPILLQKEPSNSRNKIDLYCKENNVKLNSIMNIASSNLLIEFAKAGYGIGFVTKLYVDNDLTNKNLFELKVCPKIEPNRLVLIKLKNNVLSFSANALINQIIKKD